MTTRTLKRLERAAIRWYGLLAVDPVGADYHAYCRAFDALRRAAGAHAQRKGAKRKGRK